MVRSNSAVALFCALFLSSGMAYADNQPAKAAETKPADPFAFADFTWAPGNYAPRESPLQTKYFTPEIRLDTDYNYTFNHPKDHTISGSSEVFRVERVSGHADRHRRGFQLQQRDVSLMTQFGMYSTMTPETTRAPRAANGS